MFRLVALSLLSLALSGAAYACGGTACTEKCKMPASTASASTARPTNGTTVKLTVTGMTCGSCADKVSAALRGVAHVTWVSVDAATGATEVVHDPGATNEQLLAAVNGLGHFKAVVATP